MKRRRNESVPLKKQVIHPPLHTHIYSLTLTVQPHYQCTYWFCAHGSFISTVEAIPAPKRIKPSGLQSMSEAIKDPEKSEATILGLQKRLVNILKVRVFIVLGSTTIFDCVAESFHVSCGIKVTFRWLARRMASKFLLVNLRRDSLTSLSRIVFFRWPTSWRNFLVTYHVCLFLGYCPFREVLICLEQFIQCVVFQTIFMVRKAGVI